MIATLVGLSGLYFQGGPLGFNVEFVSRNDGTFKDPALTSAGSKLLPALVRYPGGTVSNWWDWRRGGFNMSLPDLPAQYKVAPYLNYTVLLGAEGSAKMGAGISLVLNVLSSSIDEQLTFLESACQQAEEAGSRVELVEIGNEIYGTTPRMLQEFPNGTSYGVYAESFALLAAAKLCGASGASPTGSAGPAAVQRAPAASGGRGRQLKCAPGTARPGRLLPSFAASGYYVGRGLASGWFLPRWESWNAGVADGIASTSLAAAAAASAGAGTTGSRARDELGPLVDSVLLHTYTWDGLDDLGTLCPSSSVFGNQSSQRVELERLSEASGAGWKAVMGQAASGARNVSTAVQSVLSLHGGQVFSKVHVTEGNFVSFCGPARLSWAHAMYAASWATSTLSTPGVGSVVYHVLYGSPLFAAIHSFNGTFYGLCCGLEQLVEPNTLTGPGVALSVLAGASGAREEGLYRSNGASMANDTLFVGRLYFVGNRNDSGEPISTVAGVDYGFEVVQGLAFRRGGAPQNSGAASYLVKAADGAFLLNAYPQPQDVDVSGVLAGLADPHAAEQVQELEAEAAQWTCVTAKDGPASWVRAGEQDPGLLWTSGAGATVPVPAFGVCSVRAAGSAIVGSG